MRIDGIGERVVLQLDRSEAARLAVALGAGYETVSRAEYYIRTGLSEEGVRAIVQALERVRLGDESGELPFEAGVEEVENPRRPRPRG